jgi:glyoxylase-like metal-dependent hydrolase (beta-lactamase superfamily II)
VADGPARIETPLPFALRSANAWLWPGPDPLLVDCGLRTPEAWTVLDAGLRANGVDHGRGLHRLRVVVTHGHPDHAGNAARLARGGATVLALEAERPHLDGHLARQPARHRAIEAAAREHGAPDPAIAAIRARGRRMESWGEDVAVTGLRDGQRVPLGRGGEALVLAAPGHTPGSLLLSLDDNRLVTGDTLLEHITSNAIELVDADRGRYATYLRTLGGLRRFAGCTALPGHHAPFAITEGLLDGHLAKHEARRRKVLAALDAPRTAWELLPRVLPHLAEDQTFLGLCEMVGHLHALEDDGAIRSALADGVRRFKAA